MDTSPAMCDEMLPLSVSFFDFPPRNLLPGHSKVLLITSSDDTDFHLRPPLTLPPSCIMSVNTAVDTTPDLRPHKQNIKSTIMAAYQPSASFDEAFVLKASLAHNMNRTKSREDALDAAYVLAFLAFACEVLFSLFMNRIFVIHFGSHSLPMLLALSTTYSGYVLRTLQRAEMPICSKRLALT
jgi:hypothetical protein